MDATHPTRAERLQSLGAAIVRSLMLVVIAGSLAIGGCLIATRKIVVVSNTSGQTLKALTISANRQLLSDRTLDSGRSMTIHYTTAFDAEYVIDATYADGTTLHQAVGSIDPLIGASDTIEIGDHEVIYNKSFKRTGSAPQKHYP